MAYKIFREGGYFYIVDTVTGRERDGIVNNVRVTRGSDTDDNFSIYGVNDWDNSTVINISEIQKKDGSAYTLSDFILFYQSSNSVDVNVQDSTAPIIIAKASKIVVETTTTALVAKDDYVVSVTDATGFLVGQYLTIYNADADRVFFANILSISVLDITIDTPIDFEFPVGSFVSVGDTNMNVNGSVTPQIFGIRNPTAIDIPLAFDVTRIIISCNLPLLAFNYINSSVMCYIVLR